VVVCNHLTGQSDLQAMLRHAHAHAHAHAAAAATGAALTHGVAYSRSMDPKGSSLRMFGSVPNAEPLEWSWVRDQLLTAEMYWVVPRSDDHPHPRPVWGVWADDALQLSLGSPALNREIAADHVVTVHLESAIDVVIVEGFARKLSTAESRGAVEAYNLKYDWEYDLDQYGPFTMVAPSTVMAWRAAGVAGRDGFRHAGRWQFT
jgi:hypothetical protein